MAKILMVLTAAEVHANIPYSMVCMGRYGSAWNTMHRKRRWKMEFTEAEREAATRLFSQSHNWLLGKGVPDEVRMTPATYALWQKLGNFCASI